jgi:uncharacterized repeat protein (TIGR01451 family)
MSAPRPVPFVGGSYELMRKEVDAQRSVNLFPVVAEVAGEKNVAYLDSIPGLTTFSLPTWISMTSVLSIEKTQAADAIGVDEEQTYTITATNEGPDSADGSTVTDDLPAGFDFSACTIAYAGGADGPVSATEAELAAGIVITTWPLGGVVTLTITGSFAELGSYDNAAAATIPGGFYTGTSDTSETVTTEVATCDMLHPMSDVWAALTFSEPFWPCYSGPAFTVRRTSDATSTDIYFLEDGTLDTATLLAFCGSGSGQVMKWFDSSGHENHFTWSSASAPTIVSSGTLLDGVENGSGARFYADNLCGTPTGITTFLNCTIGSISGNEYFYILSTVDVAATGIGCMSAYTTNTGNYYSEIYDSGSATFKTVYDVTLPSSGQHKIANRFDRTLAGVQALLFDGGFASIESTVGAGISLANFASANWMFGGPNSSSAMPMRVHSMLIYESAKTNDEMLAIQGAW